MAEQFFLYCEIAQAQTQTDKTDGLKHGVKWIEEMEVGTARKKQWNRQDRTCAAGLENQDFRSCFLDFAVVSQPLSDFSPVCVDHI